MLRIAAILVLAVAGAKGPEQTPRESYNDGVAKLRLKKWGEAEEALLRASRSNQESIQPAATYNLGHVRFSQGLETLSGSGNRQRLVDNSEAALTLAEEALRRGGEALIGDHDVQRLIESYIEARSARKALRLSNQETSRTVTLLASTLKTWRRAAGDFYSAAELQPSNQDAGFNAGVVERHIDELLKPQKQLQQQMDGMSQRRNELGEMMKKLRGKIPKERQQGTGRDEDEEDEEDEEGPRPEDMKRDADGQQQQRLGSDRIIEPEMLKLLKEKVVPRTMMPGQEGNEGMRPGDQTPGKGKGKDW